MDYVAAILGLIGIWIVGNKNRNGFLLLMSCCFLWGMVAIQAKVYGLMVETVPLFFINLMAYMRWGRESQPK